MVHDTSVSLALCVFCCCFFFNRGNTEGTNSSNLLSDVCVYFLYICFRTDFVVLGIICGFKTRMLGFEKKKGGGETD